LHGISAILGKPEIVVKFLSEILSWRGLYIVDLSLEEEIIASEQAIKLNLDFDDGLQYYYANKAGIKIISFDKDFDKTNIQRIEPKDV
jgi:predicted nucleic acid-binding protein